MNKYIVAYSSDYEGDYRKFDNYQEAWKFFQENKNDYKYIYLTEIICEGI
jgi:hypothetical protein